MAIGPYPTTFRKSWRQIAPALTLFTALGCTAIGCTAPTEVDESSSPWIDITESAGIQFRHNRGATGRKFLPESMGAGAAFFDMDQDGDQDLLLVDSGSLPGDGGTPGQSRLYENDGSGKFRDVTTDAGIPGGFYGQGVATADYDGDGDVDIFFTALGPNRLLRNEGAEFVDTTLAAGVAGGTDTWSSSAGFFDYDLDGDLDLFVCNYLVWSQEIDLELNYTFNGKDRVYGSPNQYDGVHSYLYRNEGDGTFSDVSKTSGIQVSHPASGKALSKALAVTFVDVDGDRYPEILVANDMEPNFLFRNLADGRFEEVGVISGLGFDSMGFANSGMGIDAGDFNNDGVLGVPVGNFANEMTTFHVQQPDRWQFNDVTNVTGVGLPSLNRLSFGLFFFDYDLDGRLDLLQANGHLEDEINFYQPSQSYRQPTQLFRNTGADPSSSSGSNPNPIKPFALLPENRIGALSQPIVGRGATYADIDADGDLDVLITQAGDRPVLLRNNESNLGNWLRVRLVGGGMNRDAIGATITLVAGGVRQTRQVMPTRSYLSQVELPVTFGLGREGTVESLEVLWPDGNTQSIEIGRINTTLAIRAGLNEGHARE